MAESEQVPALLRPWLAVVRGPLQFFDGNKVALALGIVAAGAVGLFVSAHWAIALVGAVAVLALSAMESEAFLLFVVFLMPFGWVLQSDVPVRDVPVAMRVLLVAGFFLGRLSRGQMRARQWLRPALSRASLFFLCAAVTPTVLGVAKLTHEAARSVYTLSSFVGMYFVVIAWADSPQRIRKILRVLLCSTIITAGFAIFQEVVGGYTSLWLYLNHPEEYFAPWEWRATSFLNYSNSLAGYLNLVLPLGLACYVLGKGEWRKLGAWTVGLGFVALLSTQSVGGLAAFGCVLVLAIFSFVRDRGKRLLLLGAICALAIGFYIAHEILNPAHVGTPVEYDAATRFMLWGTAWGLFVSSPIAGVGWGNFVMLYGDYFRVPLIPSEIFDVHNIYLQLLSETGVLGFTLFFSLVFLGAREARRQFRSAPSDLVQALAFGVLGAILAVLVHGFVDSIFRASPQFGTLFWVVLALLVASGRLEMEGSPVGPRATRSSQPWQPPNVVIAQAK